MRNKESIKEILDYLQTTEEVTLVFDEKAIEESYHKYDENPTLAIKILSTIGGILGSLAFLGFLLIAGLYDNEVGLLSIGSFFVIASVLISKEYNKTSIDTITVSVYLIGLILLGIGFVKLKLDENIISSIYIFFAIITLFIIQNYILAFIAVLLVNGSVLMLILSNNTADLIHIYAISLTILLSFLFLKEAKIMKASKALSKLYSPLRIGLTFSFLSVMAVLGKRGLVEISSHYIWISSIIIIVAILYLISKILPILNVNKIQHKVSIYILSIFILAPTALSPAISGTILLLLLSFLVNYKTGFVLGVLSFIYAISQHYYDLNFTLLTKSILLFSSGILFLLFYVLTHKKLTADEKI